MFTSHQGISEGSNLQSERYKTLSCSIQPKPFGLSGALFPQEFQEGKNHSFPSFTRYCLDVNMKKPLLCQGWRRKEEIHTGFELNQHNIVTCSYMKYTTKYAFSDPVMKFHHLVAYAQYCSVLFV